MVVVATILLEQECQAVKRNYKRFMKNWADLPEVAKIFCDQLSNFKL
jgi:hypothetical protein